jgi:hypothetical protein
MVSQTLPGDGDTVHEPPRLDGGTQLVNGGSVPVGVRWWPSAGEAVAFVHTRPLDAEERAQRLELAARLDPDSEERAALDAENRARAARRAKSRLRRYVVANSCTRMVSLTFAPTFGTSSPGGGQTEAPPTSAEAVHGPGGDGRCVACGRPVGVSGLAYAMVEVAAFVRRLRRALRVDRLAYAIVPEFHKDGHVHAHVLLGRHVPKATLERAWGNGWVDARKFRGRGGRVAARKAAAYAGKYVSKMFDEPRAGRHRYEVGEGFQPDVVKRGGFSSLAEAVSFVEDHDQVVVYAVSSDAIDGYSGPPWLWLSLEAAP